MAVMPLLVFSLIWAKKNSVSVPHMRTETSLGFASICDLIVYTCTLLDRSAEFDYLVFSATSCRCKECAENKSIFFHTLASFIYCDSLCFVGAAEQALLDSSCLFKMSAGNYFNFHTYQQS